MDVTVGFGYLATSALFFQQRPPVTGRHSHLHTMMLYSGFSSSKTHT